IQGSIRLVLGPTGLRIDAARTLGAARGEVPPADAGAGVDALPRRLCRARRPRDGPAGDPLRRARPPARTTGEHPGAGRSRGVAAAARGADDVPAAGSWRRREGRGRRTVPRDPRTVSTGLPRVRAARTAGGADRALDGRTVV